MLQNAYGIRREGVNCDIRAAFAQFQRPRGSVWHYVETYVLNGRMIAPVGLVALENNLAIGHRAHQPIRAGANRIAIEVLAASERHDPKSAFAEVPEKRRIRLGGVNGQGEIICGFYPVYQLVGSALDGDQGAIAHRVQGPFHVFGGQWPLIMKANAMPEMKHIGLRVGNIPAFGH